MYGQAKPTRAEVIALETAYWDAILAKDGARTAELSGENALVSGMQGVMRIPKSKMAQMTRSSDWTLESYAFDDVEIITPAIDVAIIVYTVRQQVTLKGEPREMHAADASTWIRGENGWECHAHSETILSDKAAA